MRVHASAPQTGDMLPLTSTLSEIDRYLSRGDESMALSLLRGLVEDGQILGFERGRSIPKRSYTLADLRLYKIEASKLLTPEDTTVSRLKTVIALTYSGALSLSILTNLIDISTAMGVVVATGLLVGIDQIRTGGGVEFLFVEWIASIVLPSYEKRVSLHEAGHFLAAYLFGLLPKSYTLSALDYFKRTKQFNIQAGTIFCDSEFQHEIREGKLKASSLDKYTCVAVAGIVSEYLYYGHAEGGLNDMQQLDLLMRSLKFSQKKVDSELRWAVLNTSLLLKRHRRIHQALARYMRNDHSVVECIRLIEEKLTLTDDI